MGGALACGLVRKGGFPAGQMTLTARHAASLKKFARLGIQTTLDNAEAAAGAEKIFIAVKPWQIAEVAAQIAPALNNGAGLAKDARAKHIVSIAPGVSPEDLRRLFGQDAAISYAIPNTAAQNGESMTFVSHVSATAEMQRSLEDLLRRIGKVIALPPEQLRAGTAAASCGIAYALRYISAASEGARQTGLESGTAAEAIVQTVKGAVSLLENSAGTNALLQDCAKAVTCGWDILVEYTGLFPDRIHRAAAPSFGSVQRSDSPAAKKTVIDKPEGISYIDLEERISAFSEDQKTLLRLLRNGEKQIDDLIASTDFSAAKVLAEMTMLTIRGAVKPLPGKRYILNLQ